MAQISIKLVRLTKDAEYREIGQNKTKLAELSLAENHRKKVGDNWEETGTTFWDAKIWGDNAEFAAALTKGDAIDLSAYIENGEIRHRVITNEETWEGKDGKPRSKTILTIFDWEVYE